MEGVGGADYACYALRNYHILPSVFIKMDIAERMFLFATIDLEIEARKKAANAIKE